MIDHCNITNPFTSSQTQVLCILLYNIHEFSSATVHQCTKSYTLVIIIHSSLDMCVTESTSHWVSIMHIHFQTDINTHHQRRNQGGWGLLSLKFVKEGFHPMNWICLYISSVKLTYNLVHIFFLRMHYCTNTPTATCSCVCPGQCFRVSYYVDHSSAIQQQCEKCNTMNINQLICFSAFMNDEPPDSKHLPTPLHIYMNDILFCTCKHGTTMFLL